MLLQKYIFSSTGLTTSVFYVENTTRKISSENSIKKILTPYANTPHKFWQNSRDALVGELYKFFNETVFENKVRDAQNFLLIET